MKKTLFLVVLISTTLFASPHAKDYSAKAFIEEALRLSFTLKHSQLNVQQHQAELSYKSVWENPNLEIGFDDRLGDSMEFSEVEFSQKIPTFNASANKKGENQAHLEHSLEVQNQSRLNLKYQAAMLYYKLYYAQSALEIVANQIKEIQKLLDVANAREASGDISGVLGSRIKITYAQFLSKKQQLQELYAKLHKRAQYLLQTQEDIKPALLLKLPAVFESIDLESDAKILALRAEVKAQRYVLADEKSKRYPLPELFVRLNKAEDFSGGGLRFSLPLWDQNRAKVERNKINIQQSTLSLRQMQLEIENSWLQQKELYISANDQAEYYQKSVLKSAKKFYKTQMLLFKSGENSLLELLDAQEIYFDSQSSYNKLKERRDIYLLLTMKAASINLSKDTK